MSVLDQDDFSPVMMEEEFLRRIGRPGKVATEIKNIRSFVESESTRFKIRESDPFYSDNAMELVRTVTQPAEVGEEKTFTLVDFSFVENDDGNEIRKVLANVEDPVVKSFWLNEFTKFNDRTLAEVISPIQNKVGQFLSTALIRNIVGQVKSSLSLRSIMDNRKILILNLSNSIISV